METVLLSIFSLLAVSYTYCTVKSKLLFRLYTHLQKLPSTPLLPQLFLLSHLVGKRGGCRLLVIATLTVFSTLIVALLAVFGLVTSLRSGIWVLLPITWLSELWLLLLGRRLAHEWCNNSGLLEYKPQVTGPQDQIQEPKDLEEKRAVLKQKASINIDGCSV